MPENDDLDFHPSQDDDIDYESLEDLDLTDDQRRGVPIFYKGIAEGKTMTEIASEIGVNRKTLWKWRQKQEFMRAITRVYEQNLTELLPKVGKQFEEKLSGEVDSNSVDVAKTVLRASGLMEPDDQEQDVQPIQITRHSEEQEG